MHAWKTAIISALTFSLMAMQVMAAPLPASNTLSQTGLSRNDRIEAVLSKMSLEEKIGQIFLVAPDSNLEQLLQTYHVGGAILFARHSQGLQQTMELIEQVRLFSGAIPPFVAVDQEGGRVARLDFTTQVPSARDLSNLDENSLRHIGRILGNELAALGFNINFAPVLDVNTDPENPVIGDRSYGSDPATVSLLGQAYIAGLQEAGIAGCAKHFPGHGDTRSDSHLLLPVVTQNLERLESVELTPFRAAIKSGIELVMIAHVYYPALDPAPEKPATFSKRIVTGLLRETLGYSGLIITDAMNMKAITDSLSAGPAALAAFHAGVDIILMPENLDEAYTSVLSSVRVGDIPLARLDSSVRRILNLKLKLTENSNRNESFSTRLSYAAATVGSPQHRALMNKLLQKP